MKLKRKTDVAFSGAGFMGIYFVGATYCIYLIAPDLLQQRIGGTSAGEPVKNYAIMLSSRSPDQDIPVPEIDGVL